MLRQIIRVSKFWREYAGHLAVEAIDDQVMREFIPWRRDYYADFKKLPKNAKRHPTDRTIQFDMMIGKAIVRWAHGGVQRNSFGEKYSIYSFRHFYAVQALRNGVGVFEVARNMGTSVQIIQEYYGKQATASVFATRLGLALCS